MLSHCCGVFVASLWCPAQLLLLCACSRLVVSCSIAAPVCLQTACGVLLKCCSCVLAAGLYTPVTGQVWAQVGGCMAGRVGIDTLWLPFNPTTCSTAGGSIYYPNYPLSNGTNVGYMLFWNSAGETTPLPGDNAKITGIAQGQCPRGSSASRSCRLDECCARV